MGHVLKVEVALVYVAWLYSGAAVLRLLRSLAAEKTTFKGALCR